MTNSPKRILIVDDEAPMRFLLSKQLSRAGFDVATAADGPAALEAAAASAFDAIVLDLVMPGMDGFEVCRRLKAEPLTAGIPVAFLSASSSGDFRRRAFRVGAIEFLAKPFQTEQLPAYLRAILANGDERASSGYTGRVAAVWGADGGARSEAAAVELAETEALRCGCPVMLIDLELPAGSVGARLQLSGGPNVRFLLQDTGEPVSAEVIDLVAQRLHFAMEVIPAPYSPSPLGHVEPDPRRLVEAVDLLTGAGYYVVLHLGTTLDDLTAAAARRADILYAVGVQHDRMAWADELTVAGVPGDRVVALGEAAAVNQVNRMPELRSSAAQPRTPARAIEPVLAQFAAVA